MTPLAIYAGIAVVAFLTTASWSILARKTAVYVTSGLSFTAWAWLAIVGGDVAMIIETGERIWLRETVASLQWVALALAVISLVVFIMRLMGAYPSPQNNAAEEQSDSRATTNS